MRSSGGSTPTITRSRTRSYPDPTRAAIPGITGRDGTTPGPCDHADAVVLANILRTDAHAHRPLPHDSEPVQAIAVLARAQCERHEVGTCGAGEALVRAVGVEVLFVFGQYGAGVSFVVDQYRSVHSVRALRTNRSA
jgi:hypothetical protein